MPQFDPATFTPQIFWLLVTFAALYLVLWRIALPKISDVLEARRDKIDDDLEKAAALKQEAQGVLEECEAAAAEGQAKAQALIREAQAAMAREAERQRQELAARIARQIKEAEASIQASKAEALDSLREMVAEVAGAATARLIGVQAGEDRVAAAVNEVMSDG